MTDQKEYLSATVTESDEIDALRALFDEYEGTKDECIRAALLQYADQRGVDVDDLEDFEEENEFVAAEYDPQTYEGMLDTADLYDIVDAAAPPVINPDHLPRKNANNQGVNTAVITAVCRYKDAEVGDIPDVIEEVMGSSSPYLMDTYKERVAENLGVAGDTEQVTDEDLERYVRAANGDLSMRHVGSISEKFEKREVSERVGDVLADVIYTRLQKGTSMDLPGGPGAVIDWYLDDYNGYYSEDVAEKRDEFATGWALLLQGRYDEVADRFS